MRFFPTTVIVIVALAAPSVASAASIIFAANQPSSALAGKVNGSGSYTRAQNEVYASITLYAVNPDGGQGGQAICAQDDVAKTWSGTVTGLPAGDYKVFAR